MPNIKKLRVIKICPTCLQEFETISNSKYERSFCSKKCSDASRKIDPILKKEKARLFSKQYRKEHPEWTRATQKRARNKLRKNNPEHLIWMETKKRAKKRGIPFDIEIEDIIIPEICPILGIELSFGIGKVHDASPSLDRIVPERGYVKGNCFIISSKANRMKQENTLETLEKIISYIKERMK